MNAGGPPGLPPGHEPGSPAYRRITLCLFLAGLVTFASLYNVQPLLPVLVTEFGVTPEQSALAVSVTTFGVGAALLVAGPLAELYGRRRLMLGSLFATAATGAACGLAPSFGWLLVLRALEGVALAGLPAMAVAYLCEELVPRAQARAAGLYIGGTAIGGMSGRLVAGVAADLVGWRQGLFLIGVGSAVVAAIVALLLPHSRRFVPAQRSLPAMVMTTRSLLTDPALLALFGVGAVSMGALVAALNAVGFRLTEAPYGLTVGAAGLVYLVYLPGSVSSILAGRAAARYGQPAVAPWAAAMMVFAALLTLAQPLPLLIAGIGGMAVGLFALHAVASGWVADRAARIVGAPGQASSMYLFCYYFGASVGGLFAGVAWSRVGWPAVVGLCVVQSLLAVVLTIYLRQVPPRGPADPATLPTPTAAS